jgi:murein DD-endopeptidase MepM/ murein hydrolase activator NlpD
MMNKNNNILKSQHIERRRKPSYNKTQGGAAFGMVEQQRPARKRRILPQFTAPRREKRIMGALPTPDLKKILFSPQAAILLACLIALGLFSYYALLWQDNGITLNPEAEAYTRQKMLAYVLGLNADYKEETEALELLANETFAWSNYIVRKGDSVSKIASDHGLSLDAIVASNNLRNARLLREGEALRIPNMDGIPYTVEKGDSYQKVADKMNVALEAILDANDIQDENIRAGDTLFLPGAKMRSDDLKIALGELFTYPVRGRLSSPFGWRKDPFTGQRRYHSAIDLAANSGAPVKASADGRVSTVNFNDTYGNYVILTHSGGFQTMYAHLSKVDVKVGTRVIQGETLGGVGSTGRSTGPHLHFAVYKNGRAMNPLAYIKN